MIIEQEYTYRQLLESESWKNKRDEILKRDNYMCRHCGSKKRLEVHHRQYHRYTDGIKKPPWAYENKYLITLCGDCHENGHRQYKIPVYTF